ncbi:MAG TPA: acyl carrier protein [Ferruginibacter sp.]|nr:acyl carrier protein [Ferruginibacter sp.]
MDRSSITERLTPIFRKTFNDDNIVVNEGLTANDVANWDSLTHMLLIGEVENSFAVKFKLKELGRLDNVGSLVALIESKLSK